MAPEVPSWKKPLFPNLPSWLRPKPGFFPGLFPRVVPFLPGLLLSAREPTAGGVEGEGQEDDPIIATIHERFFVKIKESDVKKSIQQEMTEFAQAVSSQVNRQSNPRLYELLSKILKTDKDMVFDYLDLLRDSSESLLHLDEGKVAKLKKFADKYPDPLTTDERQEYLEMVKNLPTGEEPEEQVKIRGLTAILPMEFGFVAFVAPVTFVRVFVEVANEVQEGALSNASEELTALGLLGAPQKGVPRFTHITAQLLHIATIQAQVVDYNKVVTTGIDDSQSDQDQAKLFYSNLKSLKDAYEVLGDGLSVVMKATTQ